MSEKMKNEEIKKAMESLRGGFRTGDSVLMLAAQELLDLRERMAKIEGSGLTITIASNGYPGHLTDAEIGVYNEAREAQILLLAWALPTVERLTLAIEGRREAECEKCSEVCHKPGCKLLQYRRECMFDNLDDREIAKAIMAVIEGRKL